MLLDWSQDLLWLEIELVWLEMTQHLSRTKHPSMSAVGNQVAAVGSWFASVGDGTTTSTSKSDSKFESILITHFCQKNAI
jgi:hypothetical protein